MLVLLRDEMADEQRKGLAHAIVYRLKRIQLGLSKNDLDSWQRRCNRHALVEVSTDRAEGTFL